MVDHTDETLRHAIDVLRELPPLDDDAVARISTAAAAARARDLAGDSRDVLPLRPRLLSLRTAIGIAAAAAVVGFLARAGIDRRGATTERTATGPAGSSSAADVRAVAANPAQLELAPVQQQFVLEKRDARSVSLVGDFNGWGAQPIHLERAPGSSVWSVSVSLVPGRHGYAFMVDDSVWTPDPRAPRAKDADFGVAGSVVIVGRP